MASLLAGQLHVSHKLDSQTYVGQVWTCNACLFRGGMDFSQSFFIFGCFHTSLFIPFMLLFLSTVCCLCFSSQSLIFFPGEHVDGCTRSVSELIWLLCLIFHLSHTPGAEERTVFFLPVFPPLSSLLRHLFHHERDCDESSLDVKACNVLLQLNSSKSPSSSHVLNKYFI